MVGFVSDLRVSTAGLVLGLSVTASYVMLIAAVTRTPWLLVLVPAGAGIGWWVGRRRERQLVISEAESLLRANSER